MTVTRYAVFFREAMKRGNQLVPQEVLLIDDRNVINDQPGFTPIGAIEHPSYDQSTRLYHRVREYMHNYGITDMARVTIRVQPFERAVYYSVPEDSIYKIGDPPSKIEIGVYPHDASNSRPLFEIRDSKVAQVSDEGMLTPVEPGETILSIRASDNPILLYQVKIKVEKPTAAQTA